MGILENEKRKREPHINSYFDCRFSAYGTHMTPPSPLEEHYQPPPYREYEKTPEPPMGNFDFRTSFLNEEDTIHPVFKIKKSSSMEEFKDVYRKMILETHPDKGGDNEEFIRVRDAWEELNF